MRRSLDQSTVRRVTVLMVLVLMALAAPRVRADDRPVVTVDMQGRQFVPAAVSLVAHEAVELVLMNHDPELHAFVPVGLLEGVHVTVSGNGAPDFGTTGLRKIIVPSNGRAVIRFRPERAGDYPFFCDMPGHEMRGSIHVE